MWARKNNKIQKMMQSLAYPHGLLSNSGKFNRFHTIAKNDHFSVGYRAFFRFLLTLKAANAIIHIEILLIIGGHNMNSTKSIFSLSETEVKELSELISTLRDAGTQIIIENDEVVYACFFGCKGDCSGCDGGCDSTCANGCENTRMA